MSVSETQIQHHFLDRFHQTHGEAPENWASALWQRLAVDTSIEALETASERLIREHNGKTLPSFKVCLAAIMDASRFKPEDVRPGQRRSINAVNYYDEALAYMKAHKHPHSTGMGAMIEPGTPEWDDWYRYFGARQIPTLRMKKIHDFAKQPDGNGGMHYIVTERYMVPTVFPLEFDATA